MLPHHLPTGCCLHSAPAGAGTQVAYAVSKGALLPLSRSLAAAWGKDK